MQSTQPDSHTCDVVVLGGGPAGSAISALLVEKGWHIHLLEKDTHPRFHIGESLLPHTLPFLDRLGVLEQVDKVGVRKYGAELLSPHHHEPMTLYFSQALNASQAYAYQVRRSEFDHILLENASRKGVAVHQGWEATDARFPGRDSCVVTATDRVGGVRSWRSKFIVDATGRDTFLSSRLGSKHRSRQHHSVAVFGHFEGVQRHRGRDEGNITVCWFPHGWIWVIPLKDGITSTGAVCWPDYLKSRRTGLDQFLWDTIALCQPVSGRFRQAKLIMPAMAAGNYSYGSCKMAGRGYLMVGDAFAFIDPVFSSGVHLALNSALLGVEVVDSYLRRSADHKLITRRFERRVRKGIATYSWFIVRFMQPALRDLLMSARNPFRVREAILALLAGDVFGHTPLHLQLLMFKSLYYLGVLTNPLYNLTVFRNRMRAVRTTNPVS